MTSIGETLRGARARRNLTLDRVSEELKISARLLEAIEQEHFEKLPGGVFTKSFVRQYARYLGVDEDEVSGELQRMLDPDPVAGPQRSLPAADIPLPRVKQWETVADHGSGRSSALPALALVVVVMLICSGVYAWWQRPRPAPPPPAVVRNIQPAASPAPEPTPAEVPAAAPESAPPPGPAQVPTAAVTAPGPATLPEANPNAAVRVVVTAEEPVWVRAQSDGKSAFTDTMQANQSRTVEANNAIVLRLGNAGGVNIVLNGKAVGPVGPKGQVRTVQFTSGGFQIVPDAPKPATPPPASSEPATPPASPKEPLDRF